jgi:hypothetical protein
MRLLDVSTLELHTFYGDAVPEYAILSHNWLKTDEEVTYQQMQDQERYLHLPGYRKIRDFCKQAAANGYEYGWVGKSMKPNDMRHALIPYL